MHKIKKIYYAILFGTLLFACIIPNTMLLASNVPTVYFFYGEGCPHCAKAKEFLATIEEPMALQEFEIYHNEENAHIFSEVLKKLDSPVQGVPLILIGARPIVGFHEILTPEDIRAEIRNCSESYCKDIATPFIKNLPPPSVSHKENPVVISEEVTQQEVKIVETPISDTGVDNVRPLNILGVDVSSLSLPVLSVFLGFVDGFNPCAMWVLLFLLSMLIGAGDAKRIYVLGSAFILASSFVYFGFMVAWFELMSFVSFLPFIKPVIGSLALIFGLYSIISYSRKETVGCSVENSDNKKKIFSKIRAIVQEHNLFIALIGIIFLAFAINLVELVCSAGLPAIFTQVLVSNDLPSWKYYGYIALYQLFFMLDDIFVFTVSVSTLHLTGITTSYTKTTKIIGGIIMAAIGIILILKPSLLTF